jgi:hypothetical protein
MSNKGIDPQNDTKTILVFKHLLKGSEVLGVNVYVVMQALIDAAEAANKEKSFFNRRLRYHIKRSKSTPEEDAKDFKTVSSFVANLEQNIKERSGIYA